MFDRIKVLWDRVNHGRYFCSLENYRDCKGVLDVLNNEFGYLNSFLQKGCVDKNGECIPWYTYPAIEYLEQFDFSKKTVFEYGSGNSTCWWAARSLAIKSVEHDVCWYEENEKSYRKYSNLEYRLCEDKKLYVEELSKKYDVIIIDAQWRDLCVERAIEFLNDGGMIIIDDSQRVQWLDEYRRAMEILQKDKHFIEIDFYGFAPLVAYTKVTTVFISRNHLFPRKKGYMPLMGNGNIAEHD